MKANALCLGLLSFVTVGSLAACGPAARSGSDSGDSGDTGVDATSSVDSDPSVCVPATESCSNLVDDDCDGKTDCQDNDCSGVGTCPVCGTVENPEVQPLVLPDGLPSTDYACSTDAQCAPYAGTSCVAKLCRVPYVSSLNFVGFPQGATLDDTSKLISVCASMEHSWMRDLQIELIAPNGTIIILHDFVYPRMGGEVDLGNPNPADDGVPGTGANYCWDLQGSQTMIQTANATMPSELPPGDYKSVTPFTALAGTPLNGAWKFRITDLWPIDDGFLFGWTIKFDPSLVADCSGPIIGKTAPNAPIGH